MKPTSSISTSVQELLEDLDLFRLPVVPKEVCRRLDIDYREYRYEGIEGTLRIHAHVDHEKIIVSNTPWGRANWIHGNGKVNIGSNGFASPVIVVRK